jgi:hypothetical protein
MGFYVIIVMPLDVSPTEYRDAVPLIHCRMCNILHLRQAKIWLRPDWLFKITKYGKEQIDLLDVIHGLTKKVNTANVVSLICASILVSHTLIY